MNTLLVLMTLVPAQPAANTPTLLRTFRDEFVLISPGQDKYPASFTMGTREGNPAEQPVHEVTFSYSFAIGKYEVTQNLYEAVTGSNPSRWKGARNSVEMVSFAEAEEFCRRVTVLLREANLIEMDELVRLPTEAEWEYAARAGTTTSYSFGDDPMKLGDYAWFSGNAAGNDPPVGAKLPNPWGLYDMHGYLWEWCADVGHENYAVAPTDGSAWTSGGDSTQRVIRGGSWKDPASTLRSAARAGVLPTPNGQLRFRGGVPANLRDDAVGLRCVLADVP